MTHKEFVHKFVLAASAILIVGTILFVIGYAGLFVIAWLLH